MLEKAGRPRKIQRLVTHKKYKSSVKSGEDKIRHQEDKLDEYFQDYTQAENNIAHLKNGKFHALKGLRLKHNRHKLNSLYEGDSSDQTTTTASGTVRTLLEYDASGEGQGKIHKQSYRLQKSLKEYSQIICQENPHELLMSGLVTIDEASSYKMKPHSKTEIRGDVSSRRDNIFNQSVRQNIDSWKKLSFTDGKINIINSNYIQKLFHNRVCDPDSTGANNIHCEFEQQTSDFTHLLSEQAHVMGQLKKAKQDLYPSVFSRNRNAKKDQYQTEILSILSRYVETVDSVINRQRSIPLPSHSQPDQTRHRDFSAVLPERHTTDHVTDNVPFNFQQDEYISPPVVNANFSSQAEGMFMAIGDPQDAPQDFISQTAHYQGGSIYESDEGREDQPYLFFSPSFTGSNVYRINMEIPSGHSLTSIQPEPTNLVTPIHKHADLDKGFDSHRSLSFSEDRMFPDFDGAHAPTSDEDSNR